VYSAIRLEILEETMLRSWSNYMLVFSRAFLVMSSESSIVGKYPISLSNRNRKPPS